MDTPGTTDSFAAPFGEILAHVRELPELQVRRGLGLAPLTGAPLAGGSTGVDFDAQLAGQPTRLTRDLLRQHASFGIRVRDVRAPLGLDRAAALDYLRQLVEEGLLAAPDDLDGGTVAADDDDAAGHEYDSGHRDYRTWTLTTAGHELAAATGRKATRRRNADALARKVTAAAAEVNTTPDATLWWVKEIVAVGPFADPATDPLLYVDLAVHLLPRLDDQHEQAKAERRLQDDAEDRGERTRSWDMIGYGRWLTAQALSDRSTVVRLWRWQPGLEGRVLFTEERDLTVAATATAPYQQPAQAAMRPECTWCRRPEPSLPIAAQGESYARSTTAWCQQCLALSGIEDTRLGFTSAYRTIRTLPDSLAAQPYHQDGCALCGYQPAARVPRWPEHGDQQPVTLALCTVCTGLLHLADRADRSDLWRHQFEQAAHTGMHARRTASAKAGASTLQGKQHPGKAAAARRPSRPRLTDAHRDVLASLDACGALSAVDFARDTQSLEHQNSRWWGVRLGHLHTHEKITPLRAGTELTDRESTVWRLLADDERELVRRCAEQFVPGPRWDGTEVSEPEPPAAWAALYDELRALRCDRDEQARKKRTAAGFDVPGT